MLLSVVVENEKVVSAIRALPGVLEVHVEKTVTPPEVPASSPLRSDFPGGLPGNRFGNRFRPRR